MPENKTIDFKNPLIYIWLTLVLLSIFLIIRVWKGTVVPSASLKTIHHVFYRVEKPPKDTMASSSLLRDKGQLWQPSDIQKLKPVFPNGVFWFKFNLPFGNWKNPELFLLMPVRDFQVYEDGKEIYMSRDGLHERSWRRSNLRAHFIRLLPRSGRVCLQGQKIYIKILQDRFSYTQEWEEIKIGDREAFIWETVHHDLIEAILAFLLIFIAICALVYLMITRKIILPFIGLGLYSLCNGINYISNLIITQLIWDVPATRYYGEALAYYLIPIGIILFIATFTKITIPFRQIHPVFKALMCGFVFHAVLMTLLDVTGVISLYATYDWFSLCLIPVAVFLILCGIGMGRAARMDLKLILWGVVFSGLIGIHD